MIVFYPDTADLPLPPGHRFPAEKYRLLLEAVRAAGLVPPNSLLPSPEASMDMVALVHTQSFIDAVLSGALPVDQQKTIGIPWSAALVARSLATVGGTVAAAQAALETGFSAQLAGGTHHAHADHGAGFCVFNDCAVAIRVLQASLKIKRASILDLDVHQGDGTARIFACDAFVQTVSVHGAHNYPFNKAVSDCDVALSDLADDDAYLAAVSQALASVAAHAPDIVFYIAGVDPLACDRLGKLAVSLDGLGARDRLVLETLRARGVPTVMVAGGGYARPIEQTVCAYVQSISIAREVFGAGVTPL